MSMGIDPDSAYPVAVGGLGDVLSDGVEMAINYGGKNV